MDTVARKGDADRMKACFMLEVLLCRYGREHLAKDYVGVCC